MTKNVITGLPIVTTPTRSESTNIETIVTRLKSGRIIIPDYQRDAEQWDVRKESLFIESILNNLTIPAFFFSERDDGKIEVVDGQQRLNTIQKYYDETLIISNDEQIVYLTPQCVHYAGKKFTELPDNLQIVFKDYPLTIIYLPKDLELSTKLEIFRRINEGGTPLTAQDIRLSYYSDSDSVYFIRIAGIYTDSISAKKMLNSASKRGIENPWLNFPKAWQEWKDWWEYKALAKGQTPSEMFLWYLIFKHRKNLDQLLSTPNSMRHLGLSFRGTTEEALDIYCSQLRYTDKVGGVAVFPTYRNGLQDEFNNFTRWINCILNVGMTGISVDKFKQAALLIGAAVELGLIPEKVNNDAWDAIADFIRTPRQSGSKWLKEGYPEQRGRWSGTKGQKSQCDSVLIILNKIIEQYK